MTCTIVQAWPNHCAVSPKQLCATVYIVANNTRDYAGACADGVENNSINLTGMTTVGGVDAPRLCHRMEWSIMYLAANCP